MFVDICIGKYVGMQPTLVPNIFLVFFMIVKNEFLSQKNWTGSRYQFHRVERYFGFLPENKKSF